MSEATFNLRLLSKYQVIDAPGTHIVSVATTITDKYLIDDEHPRYIVPLRLLTLSNLELLVKEVSESEVILFSKVSKYFMSGAIFVDDDIDMYLPIKGEKVIATFDYVNDVLRCTNIELINRVQLSFVDDKYIDKFRESILKVINLNKNNKLK